jgi:hypothetical protein
MPFSEQGVPGRDVGLPDLGEDIRAVVVVVVSNGRTERKANVRGECGFEVVRWFFLNGHVQGYQPLLNFEYMPETGDRKIFTQP